MFSCCDDSPTKLHRALLAWIEASTAFHAATEVEFTLNAPRTPCMAAARR